MESPSERRLDLLGREAFDRAVRVAAEQATQNVAAIHRKRLVTQAAVVGFVVALCVALAVSLAIRAAIESASRVNALANCHLVQALSQPLADFVESDAALRQRQLDLSIKDQKLTGVFRQLLGRTEYAKLIRQSEQADRDTANHWDRSVVPRLVRVAGADCAKRVR